MCSWHVVSHVLGDDVRDDVGGAQRAGMRGILVQTGKYREGDERNAGVEPDATVPNFAAAVNWILASKG
jgi:ribonucleotide monophosphatase NagD (HAD superfamily)